MTYKGSKKKRDYNAAYRLTHREEIAAYNATYHAAHREKLNALSAAYNATHREESRAHSAAWRKSHSLGLVAYRAAHREELNAYSRAWYAAHPNKKADATARRRALRRGATVEKVSRAEVFERDRGRCHICGKKVDPKKWHLDHLLPLSKGGEHSYRNVAVTHPSCNIRKGAGRLPSQLRLFG